MATTRQQIDSRGKGLLQLLEESQSEMANVMNPSTVKGTYQGPDPNNPVDPKGFKPVSANTSSICL